MAHIELGQAEAAIAAAKAAARERGAAVSIAVVDHRGDLVALARMDGAGFWAPDFARGKAMVAGVLGHPSGAFASPEGETVMQVTLARIQQGTTTFVFMQGGMPILESGQVIGGIGVAGGPSAQDEEIAAAGAKAV
jgi:uncharacterized protein GlcG (DUF336 family)